MRRNLSLVILSMAFCQMATAQEVCSRLKDCLALKAQVESRIRNLNNTTLDYFLTASDGKILRHTDQPAAATACAREAVRLPKARELAVRAVKYGAAIVEVNEYNNGRIPVGYNKSDFKLVATHEADESVDTFYYSNAKYRKPVGDLGYYWAWASSAHIRNDYAAMYFKGDDGTLDVRKRDSMDGSVAVRCAPK